ncbi:MAG: hypothetical protein HUK21_09825 [Fibrobacteraceae bacterium]|nr:hypothetical protein [Fibrobacteraceae bacterium]
MKYKSAFLKNAVSVSLVVMVSSTVSFADYFDCWLAPASQVGNLEKVHYNLKGDQALCGCFKIRESDKQVSRVWDIPKAKIVACPNGECMDSERLTQCMDYFSREPIKLSDFAKGGGMEGAVALTYGDGWSMTPFGEYFNKRKDRAKDIDCFVDIHKRPSEAAADDLKDPNVFNVSGLPKNLIPNAVGRMHDFSDVRCLDNGELTGFAYTGVIENLRHVNSEGLLHGEEIGYLNDPTYPVKQGDKWGKIAWTSQNKEGARDGIATIYKSSVADGSDKEYYFKHLEVRYSQNAITGTTKMYSDTGFLMAEIPMEKGVVQGRITVRNPFKKRNISINFDNGKLEGNIDFGEFSGVFHEGLPNGKIFYWTIKDTCYQWMPGDTVCHTERLKKKQWGTYKMGVFQGVMECADGTKGGANIVCPDVGPDTVKVAPIVTEVKPEKPDAKTLRERANNAKERAKAARLAAKEAAEEAKIAEDEAEKAEKEARNAEWAEYLEKKAAKNGKSKAKSDAKPTSKSKKKK